jgi:polyhydroxyalkanoate synthase
MARDGDQRLASTSLFASQMDFKEPGELSLFIDESQLALLEAAMWEQGYLDARQMAGAFKLLRSNDLIWSRRLNHYLLGTPEQKSDLMAWNDDTTRMPYRMHSLPRRGKTDCASRYPRADLFGGDADRPCRAVALGIQGSPADR